MPPPTHQHHAPEASRPDEQDPALALSDFNPELLLRDMAPENSLGSRVKHCTFNPEAPLLAPQPHLIELKYLPYDLGYFLVPKYPLSNP